jgi:lambda repressor-like predicted transcriptional regulator
MMYHIYDESPSERFAALAEMVRTKAPLFMKGGAVVGFPEREWKRVTPEEEARILELRAQGLSMREVGRRVGRGESVVAKVCRANMGATVGWRRGPKRVKVDVAKVEALRAQGLCWRDVAKRMGLSVSVLQLRAREAQKHGGAA